MIIVMLKAYNSVYLVWASPSRKSPSATSDTRKPLGETAAKTKKKGGE